MLPNYDVLFADHAEKYDRFVAAEDYKGNLLRAMRQVGRLSRGQAVADLGTGTGRIAFLLCPNVRHVCEVEPAGGTKLAAETKKQDLGIKNSCVQSAELSLTRLSPR
jgi:ubiquinone/menaquinone biosynthesis C-methylase UbiE